MCLIRPGLHVKRTVRGPPEGVALLAINTDNTASRTLTIPAAGERYTLSATPLESKSVLLNGTALAVGASHTLPTSTDSTIAAGHVTLPSVTNPFWHFSQWKTAVDDKVLRGLRT